MHGEGRGEEVAKNRQELSNTLKGMADSLNKQLSTLIHDTCQCQKTREELAATLKGVADTLYKQLATLTEAITRS